MTSKLKQLVLRVAPAFKLLSLAAMGVIAWQSLQPSTGIVTLNPDAIANTVGAITALFILHVLKRRISAP